MERQDARRAAHRLVWAGLLAIALVVGAVTLPSYAQDHRRGSLQAQTTQQRTRVLEARPHVDPAAAPAIR